jgi:hypothetical protein
MDKVHYLNHNRSMWWYGELGYGINFDRRSYPLSLGTK